MVFSWLRKKKASTPKSSSITPKKVSRKRAADEWVKYGEDIANANRLEEALQCFEKAIAIYPENDFAWGDKALILDKLGNVEDALISFSKAISINPHNAITWNNKGLVLLKLKKLSQCIECFDKAIENNNAYAKAWYNKARALSMLGNISESQKCFDRARKLDPLLFTKLKRMKSA
jgi:tetratricopeptide (TPR) repeat protein